MALELYVFEVGSCDFLLGRDIVAKSFELRLAVHIPIEKLRSRLRWQILTMSDSSLPASELRNRYHRGGTATDDSLSASQLRARHGISSNKANWSTGEETKSSPIGAVAVLLAGIVFLVGVAFLMYRSGKGQ